MKEGPSDNGCSPENKIVAPRKKQLSIVEEPVCVLRIEMDSPPGRNVEIKCFENDDP